MRGLWVMPVLAAAALLTGCGDLPSVEGLANETNTVFDASLVGAWNAGDAVAVVQKGDDQTYAIHWLPADSSDAPQLIRMQAKLAKIGGQQILDLTAADPGVFAIPCHVFLRVRPVATGLKVQFVDSKWLRQQLKSSGLATFLHDNSPVLSAPAPQVEAFLLKFGLDERALDEGILLRPLKQN